MTMDIQKEKGKIRLDVHTHTVMSGHAFSTVQEMAREAARQGLDILGITEHGPTYQEPATPSTSAICT